MGWTLTCPFQNAVLYIECTWWGGALFLPIAQACWFAIEDLFRVTAVGLFFSFFKNTALSHLF